jgi:hypothetical protein
MPNIGEIESAGSSLLNYFSPTRSPYYTVAVAACFALAWVAEVEDKGQWLYLAIPAFAVALMTLFLSFDAKNVLSEVEHAEQLRFARSTSISAAVVSLSIAGRSITEGNGRFFYWTFGCCFVQVLVFVAFCWALNKEGALPGSERNYVQLTLLTSAFLVDTCVNLALASVDAKTEAPKHHMWTAIGLGILWGLCAIFWVVKLSQIIQVQRPVKPEATVRA